MLVIYAITQYEFPVFPALSSSTISKETSGRVAALASVGGDKGAAAVFEAVRANNVKKLSISRDVCGLGVSLERKMDTPTP